MLYAMQPMVVRKIQTSEVLFDKVPAEELCPDPRMEGTPQGLYAPSLSSFEAAPTIKTEASLGSLHYRINLN